jgi:TPR repeat protein
MPIQERCTRTGRVLCVAVVAVLLLLAAHGWATTDDNEAAGAKPAPHPISIAKEVAIANDYLFGRGGVAQDSKKAAYWLEKAAGSGAPEAQMELGYFYETGIGVTRNMETAARWYRLAAYGGLSYAKASLGILYFWGTGVPENKETAARFFLEAAQKGIGLAAYQLGAMYAAGAGVPRDMETAELWYEKGVKLHNPQAEHQLGLLYFNGADHKVDLRKSESLLRSSASKGFVPAMHSLGMFLTLHPDRAKFQGEGVQLLESAARAGMWRSSEVLGVMARDGNETRKDDQSAYYRFRIASLQGGDQEQKRLEGELQRLAAGIDPSTISALDSEAQAWYQNHNLMLEFAYKKDGRAQYPVSALGVPKQGTHQLQLYSFLPDERTTDRGVESANVLVK